MPIDEFKLSDVGLANTATAASLLGVSLKTVQNWIAAGLIPACNASPGGTRTIYVMRISDLKRFHPPARGRPVESGKKKRR